MTKIRVFVADDHAVLRAGLKLLIDAETDMIVVGEAADGLEAVRRAKTTTPDIVLLDLSMPGPRATETIASLMQITPRPRVLVLTMHDDPTSMESALRAGASGYIVKKAADVELLMAIRAVRSGRTFVDLTRPGEAAPAERDEKRRLPLSQREGQVLRLLARGYTNQEAANELGVSVKTVETHRKRLTDKLGLKTRAQLFRFAVERGLFKDAV